MKQKNSPADKILSTILSPVPSALIIFAALYFAYSETFDYPFHFDDDSTIKENDAIKNLWDIGAIWNYNAARFLTFLSLAFNYHIGGLDVFGYHIFNFAVHLLCVFAVYWLADLLINTKWGVNSLSAKDGVELGGWPRSLFPLFIALPFALHPLQTESVTYIWQRNSSMTGLFYILSMIFYLKSALPSDRGAATMEKVSRTFLTTSLFFGVAAMLTKQNAVTLPVSIALMDLYFISGSLTALRARVARLAAFVPVLLIIPVLTALGMNQEVVHIGARYFNMLSPLEYLYTQCNVIVTVYFKLLVYPFGQNLDYEFAPARSLVEAWPSALFLTALALWGLYLWKKNRLASFGILFFFISMSVESSFYPLEDLVFEHRMYLPMFGLFLALASILFRLANATGKVAAFATLALVLGAASTAMAVVTKERNFVWSDSEILWKDVVSKSPKKVRGYVHVGKAYRRKQNLDEAEKWFRKALEIDPNYNVALFSIGLVYEDRGMNSEAIEYMKKSIESYPGSSTSHFSIGNIYMKEKNYREAAKHYGIGIKLDGGASPVTYHAYGSALAMAGFIDPAIEVYKLILQIDPGFNVARSNLKALYLSKGDKASAEAVK